MFSSRRRKDQGTPPQDALTANDGKVEKIEALLSDYGLQLLESFQKLREEQLAAVLKKGLFLNLGGENGPLVQEAIAELGKDPEDLDGLKTKSTMELRMATLSLAEAELVGGVLSEKSGDQVKAFTSYQKATLNLAKVFGEDHPFPCYIRELVNGSDAVDEIMEKDENPSSAHPHFELTDKGFKVRFRLPRSYAEGAEEVDIKAVTAYLMDLTEKAEAQWAENTSSSSFGKYNNSCSTHSVLNTCASKGPKLYDPTGEYRGRLSSNNCASESITNNCGRFGSDVNRKSVAYQFGSLGDGLVRMKMLYGVWEIVADQS